ncbi:MAG: putative toxin-antitoxin system toxin component, PIN family [Chloroflexota bacterium]|nr:putative toxin-antitoxin system toxin component, PIN family [Chloroflexota bacterium]
MIRVTLDTNVLASGATSVAGPVAILMEAWRRADLIVVVSSHILAELEEAPRNPYFAQQLDRRARNVYLRLVRQRAIVIPITTPVPTIVSEYDDNLVLATADSGGVAYLVTGDAELLRLGAFRDVAILSPRSFLAVLDPRERAEP